MTRDELLAAYRDFRKAKAGLIPIGAPAADGGMWNATCKCGAKAYVGFTRVECQASCGHPRAI